MNKLLELRDISLIPADKNNGNVAGKYDFSVTDDLDNRLKSLPIFTAPMDTVVNENNWKVWVNAGIRPVLPRTLPLDLRLEGCQYVFTAFSLKEVKENFATRKRNSSNQFKICIDSGNGHDSELFNVGRTLKQMYGQQVNLMGGNIGSAKVYLEYCHTGFDYVRVGMASGSLVDEDKFGFYYPQASLLIDIKGVKETAGIGLKHTKIIADGGLDGPVDILKAIALGADYVMMGREFARLVEAAGPIYRKERNGDNEELREVSRDAVAKLSFTELRNSELKRLYCGNTTIEMQARRSGFNDVHDWMSMSNFKKNLSDARCDYVKVNNTLKDWEENLFECLSYGFTMSNAVSWQTFKSNVKYIRKQ